MALNLLLRRIFFVFFSIHMFAGHAFAMSLMQGNWEYQWTGESDWVPTDYPCNPPGFLHGKTLELKYGSTETAETIFIRAMEQSFDVFYGDEKRYSYSRGGLPGFPMHIIEVNGALSNLRFVIPQETETHIGLCKPVYFGSQKDFFSRQFQEGLLTEKRKL